MLPVGTRGWETIPGVIRDDGIDEFRLEVDTNGEVAHVLLGGLSSFLIPPQSPPIELRDDGLGSDRVAGDDIHTAGPFRFDVTRTLPPNYLNDPSSPAGLYTSDVGRVEIEELDSEITRFLINPSIGYLRADIPSVSSVVLSPDLVATAHLINLRTSTREVQQYLRFTGGSLADLSQRVYQDLPDRFDFLMFLSTNKVEHLPRTTSFNFVSGRHANAQIDFTGAGIEPFDNSAAYGSDGRLLGLNAIDAYDRGIHGENVTHELIHQWVANLDASLGLNAGPHYDNRSSVGSLVGGFAWEDNHDGTFTIDCDEGLNGATHVAPLDAYMMGLIPGSALPVQRVYSASSGAKCAAGEPVTAAEIVTSVSIDDIQSMEGVRSPEPATAQRHFTLGFVAESHERLLNATELTFYDILADAYTQELRATEADPRVEHNWVTITRYFGHGTSWSSEVLGATQTPGLGGIPEAGLVLLMLVIGFVGARPNVPGSAADPTASPRAPASPCA
jgi:hypothetical protein